MTDEQLKSTTKSASMALPAWAPIAVNAVGSALSALGGASQAKQQQKEQKAQRQTQERMGYAGMGQSDRQFGFNANMGRASQLDNRALMATTLQGQLNRAPMADQAQYLIQQRLGMAPQAFQPRDITRGGTGAMYGAPTGGVAPMMAQMAQAAQNYRPGMGGVDTSVMRETMGRLRDESQVPGEYQAQTGEQQRLAAMRGQLMQQLNGEKRPAQRERIMQRIAELDRMGQSGTAGVDTQEYAPQISAAQQKAMQEIMRRFGPGVMSMQAAGMMR